MFVEFIYANMTIDSILRDLTSLNSASLRFRTSLIVGCSQCQNFY
jgi:hypothetical protein